MAATTEIALKLLVDTKTKKVVFAEATKDFVDLLFGFLQVPVGSIMKKLSENGKEWSGSIGNVYKSVRDLESSYFPHNVSKDLLLWPDMSSSSKSISIPPLLQTFASPEGRIQASPSANVACEWGISTASRCLTPSEPEGFVSKMTQYMVMDDLTVKPLSPISTITLLNSIGVKDFSSLVEKNVTINFKKWLELVKTSFASNTVLSDVFVEQPGTTADTETLERQTSKDE